MAEGLRESLLRQLEIGWALLSYHLDGLGTEECLRRPAPVGPHVHRGDDGRFRADWPEREDYGLGPPSVAWITWHIVFWWSMVIDHSFGERRLTREEVSWPGSADAVRQTIGGLHETWRTEIEALDEDDLRSTARCRWPFEGRAFGDVVAWANVELVKNAAELGYARFVLAVRGDPAGGAEGGT